MERRVSRTPRGKILRPSRAQNDKSALMLKKNAHPNRDERDARGTTLIPVDDNYDIQALSRVRPTGLYSRSGNVERLRLSYSVGRNGISSYVQFAAPGGFSTHLADPALTVPGLAASMDEFTRSHHSLCRCRRIIHISPTMGKHISEARPRNSLKTPLISANCRQAD